MSDTVIPVQNSQLPSGFCPAGYAEMLAGFTQHQFITLENQAGSIVSSASKPTDQSVLWLQLDQFGRPVRLYSFAQGAWLSLHPQVPGSVMIWTDALPDFTTFDGGDGNPLSAISGAMWEVATDLAAKFPLGAGTLASGTVVAIGDTGGEETHELLLTEIPAHTHNINGNPLGGTNQPPNIVIDDDIITGTTITKPTESTGGDGSGDTVAHQNMPPFLGVSFLRRTNRQFYAIT